MLHNILNGIDLENVVNALHNAGKSFKSHSRINIFALHFGIIAVSVAVELTENEIPDLYDIILIALSFKACLVKFSAAANSVEMYLAARTARSRTMLPEIIFFAKTNNSVMWNTDIILPNLLSLVVAFVYSYPKAIGRDLKSFSEKFPCPCYGFGLEIIAEREISEHFKICTVPRSFSDAFNVGSSDALLTRSNSYIRRNSLSQKILFQRSHTRIYKKQAFIPLRHKRRACHSRMILAFKKRKIFFTKFVKSCPLHMFITPLIPCGTISAEKVK